MPADHINPSSTNVDLWSTRAAHRRVLAIAHNVTAATRLFEVLPVLAQDDRVQVVFTRTGSSAFDEGTHEFLATRGVRKIPWDEAMRGSFDMAISASYGGGLHELNFPLVIVPHGMGYNKLANREPVFGLAREWLMYEGRVVPSVVVLSHDEQLDRLRRDCPEAAARAVLAGDLVYDRLVASMALRASYRRAFGLSPEQNLIVVSSTWGQESLLGRCPHLPIQLAERLRSDEFTILLALHPNVWFGHSRWEVSTWLASARRAGVYVPDDVDEWRAALLAADLTIGDHGSVTFYSAGLGTPILLASAPIQAVASDSPIAELLAAASELDLSRELEGQVRVAMAGADRDRLRAITDLATSQPGLAATRLRSVFYRLLELTEPDWAAEIDVIPLPSGPIEQAGAHLVWVRQTGPRSAVITRRPAERLRNDPWTPRGHHLAVSVVEARQRWLALADVVIGTAGTDTLEWIAGTLELMPGCQLATAPDAA